MYRIKTKLFYQFGKAFPAFATKILYKKVKGKSLNLKNPKTLTEKMQWLKLYKYSHNPVVTQCADKYAVREYVSQKGCEEILNDLYGVYSNVEAINWNELPEKFVIKCNHGCAYNLICQDKKTFDIKNAEHKLNEWLHEKYGHYALEQIYDDIEPKIICEKFIETEDGKPLKDYKIFCSYGVPKLIYVISDRREGVECIDYYTPDWRWIPVKNGVMPNAGDVLPKPQKLNEMLAYAKILSQDFPMVRVDLYCEFGKIVFGELTFLATGGMAKFTPEKYDEIFGEMFPIRELE